MVLVEYALGVFEAQVVFRILVPWQVYHGLQVVYDDGVVGTLGVDGVQFVKLFVEGLCRLLVPFLGGSFFLQFLFLGVGVVVAQFCAYVLYLLLQEVFLLLLVQVAMGLLPYPGLYLEQLHLLVHGLEGKRHPGGKVSGREHGHLVVQIKGHIGADEVGEQEGVADVAERIFRLATKILVVVQVFHGLLPQHAVHGEV